jgi:hypothetical protein
MPLSATDGQQRFCRPPRRQADPVVQHAGRCNEPLRQRRGTRRERPLAHTARALRGHRPREIAVPEAAAETYLGHPHRAEHLDPQDRP